VSQENVELVMRLFAAPGVDLVQALRDDNTSTAWTEANARFFHPDFKSVRTGVPDGKTFTGLDGLREMWLEWVAPWKTYRVEFEEVIDRGDRVLLLARAFGRLEGSQAEVENIVAGVWTVSDGMIARAEYYLDRAEALKAVGLEE
jgi:ketosteroid isomerase-like protein